MHVEELGNSGILLDKGTRARYEETHRCLRLHGINYASSQGLTLKGWFRLETAGVHFSLKHLYVGAFWATSSTTLLEVC